MTRDDIMEAIEGARDHGKEGGFGGYSRLYRAPSTDRIARWIVRSLRELEDQSITAHEIIDLLEDGR